MLVLLVLELVEKPTAPVLLLELEPARDGRGRPESAIGLRVRWLGWLQAPIEAKGEKGKQLTCDGEGINRPNT